MNETADTIRWKNLCNFLKKGGYYMIYGVSDEDAKKGNEEALKEIREIEEKYNFSNRYEARV
jgi:hypothetical protein